MTNKDLEKFFYVSNGNLKLKSNENVRFLVWSIPAVVTCPNRTGHCEKFCYARKAEMCYPGALASRQRNLDFSKTDLFVPYMIEKIANTIKQESRKNRIVWIRIHESGDFYSQEYTDKWLEIARHFENENVVFHAYTKSFAFFDGVELPANFRLVASVWDDTPVQDLVTIARNGWRIYTAYEGKKPEGMAKCNCADCAKCKMCINENVKTIGCEIH